MKRVTLKKDIHRSFSALVMMASAMLVAAVLMFPLTAYAAEEYKLYIGSTQVTSDNADNILNEIGEDGNPTAWYEVDTKTLHLNGVHIDENDYYPYGLWFRESDEEYGRYSLCSGKDVVLNVVVTGENTFVARGPSRGEGGYVGIWFDLSDNVIFNITGDGSLRSEAYDTTQKNGLGMVISAAKNAYIGKAEEDGPTLYLYGNWKGLQCYAGTTYVDSGTVVAVSTSKVPYSREEGWDEQAGIFVQFRKYFCIRGGIVAGYGPLPVTGNIIKDKGIEELCYTGEPGWEVFGTSSGPRLNLFALDKDPTDTHYTDMDIDVLGFTENATIYSVDVEWGAMTFQYELNTWDATEHKTVAGAGWKVYDSEKNKALDETQDTINQITVTNHSNAGVYATLAYAGSQTDDKDYTDTEGVFSKKEDDTDTTLTEKTEDLPDYLTLTTADNSGDAAVAGTPTTGTVYFMPTGIKEEYKTADGITKWSQIGAITVGIQTEEPSA